MKNTTSTTFPKCEVCTPGGMQRFQGSGDTLPLILHTTSAVLQPGSRGLCSGHNWALESFVCAIPGWQGERVADRSLNLPTKNVSWVIPVYHCKKVAHCCLTVLRELKTTYPMPAQHLCCKHTMWTSADNVLPDLKHVILLIQSLTNL